VAVFNLHHHAPVCEGVRTKVNKAMRMRIAILALSALLGAAGAAQAAVQINIDKDTQTMTVAVDGVQRWSWPVSSGLPSYETPNGSFKAFRLEEDHYSKEWDEAPMPHSIFFTKRGHAIHGTDAARRLGSPASHGCVRLSRENAAKLFALVQKEGVLNTTVTLSGSSQVALARSRNPVATAQPRRARVQQAADIEGGNYGQPYSRQQPGYQQSYQYDDSDIVYPDGRRGAPRGAPLAGDMRAPQPYQTQPYAQRRVYPQPYYQQDQGYYVQPQQQPYPYQQPRYYNSY